MWWDPTQKLVSVSSPHDLMGSSSIYIISLILLFFAHFNTGIFLLGKGTTEKRVGVSAKSCIVSLMLIKQKKFY